MPKNLISKPYADDQRIQEYALKYPMKQWNNFSPIFSPIDPTDKDEEIYRLCSPQKEIYLKVKGKKDLYQQLTPAEFAERWANSPINGSAYPKPKRSFGQWMRVIFSFGAWKPDKEYKWERYQQYNKWNAYQKLYENGVLRDEEFAKLKEQYQPYSTLKEEDVRTYLSTGKKPLTEQQKKELAERQARQEAAEIDKLVDGAINKNDPNVTNSAYHRTGEKIYNAVNGWRVEHDVKYPLERMQKALSAHLQTKPKDKKRAFLTAGYYAKLADNKPAFDDFCKEYCETYRKLLDELKSPEMRNAQYGGQEYAEEVMYDLQTCVALTKGKVTLSQLYEANKDPNAPFKYSSVFALNKVPELKAVTNALTGLVTANKDKKLTSSELNMTY